MNHGILLRIQNSDDIDEVKRIAAALCGLLAANQRFRLKQCDDLHKVWLDDMHDIQDIIFANQALDSIT